jgi:hypothetical protein
MWLARSLNLAPQLVKRDPRERSADRTQRLTYQPEQDVLGSIDTEPNRLAS